MSRKLDDAYRRIIRKGKRIGAVEIPAAVRMSLTSDLLKEPWRSRVEKGACNKMTGHCYVASEAAYHLMGGARSGWKPMHIRHEGSPHWYLEGPKGVIDITKAQFNTPVPYHLGKGKGFLTKAPSKRARVVIDRARKHLRRR
jgi:hypothetical protein